MRFPDGVVPSFMYSIELNGGEIELDLDPATDYIVRVRKFGANMLKVVEFDEDAPMKTYFVTDDVAELLTEGNPIPMHPTGGRLDVVQRAFMFEHEYRGWIDAQASSLDRWIDD